jgi:very-short-patch-repair endonuclease
MLRNLTSLAKGMRRRQTDAEARLWSRLRNRQLEGLKFRRVPRGRYVADLVCDEAMLIVEVDGSQHWDREAEDKLRTAYLESLGYLVLRFWNVDVLRNTDRVLDHILEVATGRRNVPASGSSRKRASGSTGHVLPKERRVGGARRGEML